MRWPFLVLAAPVALALASFGCDQPSPSTPSPADAGHADAGRADASLAPPDASFRWPDASLPELDASIPSPDASLREPDAGPCTTGDGGAGVLVRAFRDWDRDGHGGGRTVAICSVPGSDPPQGFQLTSDDCDDDNAGIWRPQPFYPNRDGDGVGQEPAELLCASTPPKGYSAKATDCAPNDGMRWQMLRYKFRDGDGDGFTVPSLGEVCAGFVLPSGYSDLPNGDDCDDTDPNQWQLLEYAFRDADGDSYFAENSGAHCAGFGLPAGYSKENRGPLDCDDTSRLVGPGAPSFHDVDGDGVGDGAVSYLCSPKGGYVAKSGDCAPDDAGGWQMLSYSYRDADGDGWTTSRSGQICSGTQLPAGYSSSAGKGGDCDDSDPAVHARVYGYPDADGDGFGAGASQTLCTAGALPADYAASNTDCAPDDPTGWRAVTNLEVDRDGDGHTIAEAGTICIGAELPAPYADAAKGNDCDDGNPGLWRWVVLYPDRDGDGVGAPPREIQCLGSAIPAGYSTAGWDRDDGDSGVQWDPAELDFALVD